MEAANALTQGPANVLLMQDWACVVMHCCTQILAAVDNCGCSSSRIDATLTPGASYIIIVKGFAGAAGPYVLTVQDADDVQRTTYFT